VATLLADPQPASSDESTAAEAAVVQTAPPDGAAPAPSSPSEPAATARNCAKCGSPLAPGQDWCLQCGAGAPGSLGTPGWRSAATILIATAVLAIGAAAAAYAALDKGTPKTHVLTTTVAQASTPAITTPTSTTPGTLGTPTTVQPLPQGNSKVPKIPLTASLPKTSGKSTATTPTATSTTPSPTSTSTTPSSSSTGSTSSEPQPVLLDTDAASTYNPYNFPAANFGDPSLTIDGDPSTAWSAQVEAATAPNMAEGVLIDLKEQQKLTALKLITSTPGVTVQVYGAKGVTAPTSITDAAWIPLSHQELAAKKHLRIKLRDSSKAFGFVVLWISKAPATSTAEVPGHVDVNELELFPTE
jgi:hypothetical protein